jgi:hypothetical protein
VRLRNTNSPDDQLEAVRAFLEVQDCFADELDIDMRFAPHTATSEGREVAMRCDALFVG